MPKRPAISVLMPVRDAQNTVTAAVRSVLAQSWRDWELVVVDDGSKDDTAEMLEAFAKEDSRLVFLRQQAAGIVAALNHGLEYCRGDFIARMDADDVMQTQRLELQHTLLCQNADCGLVSCRVKFGGNGIGYAAHVTWINSLIRAEEMCLRRFVEAPVAHPSVMFRRACVEEHGAYREGPFPEDYELWLRWLEAGVSFRKVDAELLTWNDPPLRLSRTDQRYSVEAFYAMKLSYLQKWLVKNVIGRELWLWGAGRITRQRFASLPVVGYIDVDEKKRGQSLDGRPVRLVDELPLRDTSFILAGVAARGAREAIHAHLTQRGWREGADFMLVA